MATDDGSFGYDQSLELCKSEDQYLASLVEKEDFKWFENRGQELRKLTKSKDIYARIDGVRYTTCRSNPKTADCRSPKGYLYVTDNVYYPQKVWYNISLSGSSWKLTYTTSSLCPSNYNTYVTYADGRQNCVIILWSNMTVGGYQNVSDTTCKQFGGTLPTLNFPIDVDVFTYLANLFRNNFAASEFYIRIDGVRTKSCQSNPNSTACLTPEGFTFTDPNFLNSFQQYDWVTNAGAKKESDDNCLVLVYPNTTKFMQVDVRSCTTKGTLQSLGMLCAKPAFT
ncbi:hypothetical protein B9Z55_014075 [Caenorhabditis nigoni]|uniref:C-type lectin domain-containing protein n=1 Tax=Caenorhabditis nigoni TaxID=1611254 RepID=A0A2G5U596_9PELO|nr:hypothetical protein B9Z55_014075 [Caenorhabditis nigoni]